MSNEITLEVALAIVQHSTSPRAIQLRILQFAPVALQLIEDAIAGKLDVPIELRLEYAAEYLARAGFGEVKRNTHLHLDTESQEWLKELTARAAAAQNRGEPTDEVRKEHPMSTSEWYLDDDLLHAYTEFAANQHSLELVALAHSHRDYRQLREGGYLKMKQRIQDAKRHEYVQALVDGKRKYSFATTANLSELFEDAINAD
jgi:hypothetical protein